MRSLGVGHTRLNDGTYILREKGIAMRVRGVWASPNSRIQVCEGTFKMFEGHSDAVYMMELGHEYGRGALRFRRASGTFCPPASGLDERPSKCSRTPEDRRQHVIDQQNASLVLLVFFEVGVPRAHSPRSPQLQQDFGGALQPTEIRTLVPGDAGAARWLHRQHPIHGTQTHPHDAGRSVDVVGGAAS